MPNKVFENINSEKKKKIIEVSIAEFAKYGYENASTLRIVADSGISKGSLFKYFTNKESLYFYVLDIIFTEYEIEMERVISNLPLGIFERVVEYSSSEFEWYLKNKKKFKIIIEAIKNTDSILFRKIEDKYSKKSNSLSTLVFSNLDERQTKSDNKKFQNIIKWTLEGFNREFNQKINIEHNQEFDLELLKKSYITQLNHYLELLKEGIIN